MMERAGEYDILEEIGRGRFAVVYKARHTTKDKYVVALKVLRPELITEPKSVERFKREARNAKELDHPHIAKVYEIGEDDDGRFYIAMELVYGSSLARRIQQGGPIPWEEALDILEQTASALDYAHEQGVIHRDIKPSNILLDLEKGVLLGDFGLSKAIEASGGSLTATGSVLGTVNYISPEIWNGKDATPASDVYALGCVFYEMITGDVLFSAGSPMVIMKLHETGPQLDATKVEKGNRKILLKALDKSPHKRYQRAGEFVAALRGAAERTKATVFRWNWACFTGAVALVVIAVLLCWSLYWGGKDKNQTVTLAGTPSPTVTATGTPTPTVTVVPTRKPLATATHMATPSPSPSLTPTATHTPTDTPTKTPTQTSTLMWVPQAVSPALMAPAGGETYQNPITFQWSGSLNPGQAYQVLAYHSGGSVIQSELLTTQSWITNLAGDLFGEWRWRVLVVAGEREITTSPEWSFWFQPFSGASPTQPGITPCVTPPTATPPS
jgi:serine/threonine-protein kinase